MNGSAGPIGAFEPLSEAAIKKLMAHPRFREACMASANGGVAHFLALGDDYRWLIKDIGRLGICVTAAVLDSLPDGLTAKTLVAACLEGRISSAGRVHEMLRRLERSGALVADDDVPPLRTRRRLRLTRQFLDVLRGRLLVELHALELLAPGIAPFAARLSDERAFTRFVLQGAALSSGRADLFANRDAPITDFFLQREAGMLILFDLMSRMPADRPHLLGAPAPLSRNALAGRYGVSRAHINKLLADAECRGYLTVEAKDRVVFAPAVSDALARFFALSYELFRAASQRTAPDLSVATPAA